MKFTEIIPKINNFFTEVRREIKKVNWPTPKETVRYTLIIISVSIVIAIFLGGVDFLFKSLLEKFIL